MLQLSLCILWDTIFEFLRPTTEQRSHPLSYPPESILHLHWLLDHLCNLSPFLEPPYCLPSDSLEHCHYNIWHPHYIFWCDCIQIIVFVFTQRCHPLCLPSALNKMHKGGTGWLVKVEWLCWILSSGAWDSREMLRECYCCHRMPRRQHIFEPVQNIGRAVAMQKNAQW